MRDPAGAGGDPTSRVADPLRPAFIGDGAAALDGAFLAVQTFGDPELRREVLGLFVAQSRRVVPTLPGLGPPEQADAAHLLKGSALGIGAWAAAGTAAAYEAAAPDGRAALFPALARAFARVEAAIVADDRNGSA